MTTPSGTSGEIGTSEDGAPAAYRSGEVTSRDGTTISYRQLGEGPGIIAVHGGMQAAQSFMKLATALSDDFTVYLPDRRGRGLSGPPGDHYGLEAECDDIDALLTRTGARNVFGLSSGAIIALQSALILPAIDRVALYEPPLSINGSTPMDWVARFDREVASGDLASAMITGMTGSRTAPPFLRAIPRFLLTPLMNHFIRVEASRLKAGDVPMRELIATLHCDAQLVVETEGALDTFGAMSAAVLLLGGSKSADYLKTALDALAEVLPEVRRVELADVGHLAADNSGKPEHVADELRRFFTPT